MPKYRYTCLYCGLEKIAYRGPNQVLPAFCCKEHRAKAAKNGIYADASNAEEIIKNGKVKLCSCCGIRPVPEAEVKIGLLKVKLTRLCPFCWSHSGDGSISEGRLVR